MATTDFSPEQLAKRIFVLAVLGVVAYISATALLIAGSRGDASSPSQRGEIVLQARR